MDEAIKLLRQYDMNSSIGIAHHLSIADATGIYKYSHNPAFLGFDFIYSRKLF